MAQASSAAREPSMEEILASIRRIIEDSDVTRQGVADVVQAEKPVLRSEPVSRGEVAPFRRPNVEAVEAFASNSVQEEEPASISATISSASRNFERPLLQEKAAAAPASKPETLRSSVISAVSAAIEQPEETDTDAPVFHSDMSLRGAFDVEQGTADYVAVKPVPANDASMDVDMTVTAQPEKSADAADFNVREKVEQSVENDIHKIISEMMEKQPEAAPEEAAAKPAAPLASASTKQQVSASFEQLSEAVRQERIRSLEEQAEALLRPMLQNWLDENLPSMVERLVREEIERMVRGDQY
ncbi:hypothetical protein FHS77_000064 [Paenochrobactrum gallinarii]|uniref:DUF2497 domain-containing protein n=1 Tax=Paenochrobactrum gallinarii TaxID=643673 RepID=A0A841LQS1_9HYPH|nr:DUF2497 domain-containing protein [Paenochrobactrum gallinarii]MBB6259556.1 hypothetical protein [Paenochrobactrum gallinarii]